VLCCVRQLFHSVLWDEKGVRPVKYLPRNFQSLAWAIAHRKVAAEIWPVNGNRMQVDDDSCICQFWNGRRLGCCRLEIWYHQVAVSRCPTVLLFNCIVVPLVGVNTACNIIAVLPCVWHCQPAMSLLCGCPCPQYHCSPCCPSAITNTTASFSSI